MKLKKILIISGVVLVAAAIAAFTIVRAQSGYTKVLTAKVVRQNLVSIVSGTGQIRPKTYVNIGATSFGRITHLYVKEGDHVKKGQILATVESVQAKPASKRRRPAFDPPDTDISSLRRRKRPPKQPWLTRKQTSTRSFWIGSERRRCTKRN